MLTSSSFHRFNGDSSSRMERMMALLTNAFYTALPGSKINTHVFKPDINYYPSNGVDPLDTPGRILSNLFWKILPGGEIRKSLGGTVNLLDMGCGKGRYLPVLNEVFDSVDSYTGVDLQKQSNWADRENSQPEVHFFEERAENVSTILKDHNLIVSQSTMGFVLGDMTFFQAVSEYAQRKKEPVLQIHLIPPFPLWRLRGVNGYRGYTERNLNRIIDIYTSYSDVMVYLLGGKSCIKLHSDMISDYLDALITRRGRKGHHNEQPETYHKRLRESIAYDLNYPPENMNSAAFIALTIASNVKDNPFKEISALS